MDTVVASIAVDPRGVKKGVDAAVKQLDRLPKKTRSVAQETSKSFKAIGASIFSIKGAIVSAFAGLSFASIIGEGRKFGAALGDLSAITGATGSDLDFLADKSREFGRTTTLTAVEAAQAFKLIASAKPDLLESGAALAEVTEQAIILAEASGQDLPAAASALGASLNQFSAGADSASQFINVLAEGSKRGAASIAETSEALKFAGVVAADAGLSFETTVAAIQQLSKVAIKGGEAGTGLRNVILRLAATGERELDPAVVGLSKALENLNKKQLSTVKLTEIFGLRSVVAAKSLLTQVDSLRQLETQVTGTNTALEQQAARVNNLDGDIKQLGSAISDLKIGLEQAADDGLRKFTQGFTDVIRAIGDNIDGIVKLTKVIGILATAIISSKLLTPIIVALAAATKATYLYITGMTLMEAGLTAVAIKARLAAAALALTNPALLIPILIAATASFFAFKTVMEETEVSASDLTRRFNGLTEAMTTMNEEARVVALRDAERDLVALKVATSNAGSEVLYLADQLENADPKSEKYAELSEQLQDAQANAANLADQMFSAQDILNGLKFVGPTATDAQLAATANAETQKLIDSLEDLTQRGRGALEGVFPEQEAINKLRDAQAAIVELKEAISSADPTVRKELEATGTTLENLDRAYAVHEASIEKLQKKQAELSGTAKDYKTELEKVDKALWLSSAAADDSSKSMSMLALEYEFAEGKLKKLAGTTKEAALTEKVAQLERARLTAGVVQQTEQLAKANKLGAIAQKQGFAITQAQLLQYELTEGALKNLNDEKVRGNLIRQVNEADRMALVAEAETISDSLNPLQAYNKEIANLTRLHKAGVLATDDYSEAMKRLALANNEAAGIIKNEFGTVFGDLLNGTKSVSEAFVDMGDNIIKSLNDLIGKKVGEQLFDSLFAPGAAAEGTTGIADLFSGAGAAAGGSKGEDEGGVLDKIKGVVGSLFGGGASTPDAAQGAAEMLYTTANPLPVRIVSGGAAASPADALASFMGPMQSEETGEAAGGFMGPMPQAEADVSALDKLTASISSMLTSDADKADELYTAANPMPARIVAGGESLLPKGGLMGPMPLSPEEQIQEDAGNGFADFFADMQDGAGSLWDSVKGGFDTVIGGIGSGFNAAIGAVAGMFGGAGGGGAMKGEDYLALAGNLATSYFSGGGTGGAATGGNFAVSDFQKLQGFAGGGDFRVGGGGGIDSQLVAFRASPNERVRVTRPQDANKGTTMQVHNTFNIAAPDGNVSEASQKQIAGRVQTSIALAQRRTQ